MLNLRSCQSVQRTRSSSEAHLHLQSRQIIDNLFSRQWVPSKQSGKRLHQKGEAGYIEILRAISVQESHRGKRKRGLTELALARFADARSSFSAACLGSTLIAVRVEGENHPNPLEAFPGKQVGWETRREERELPVAIAINRKVFRNFILIISLGR